MSDRQRCPHRKHVQIKLSFVSLLIWNRRKFYNAPLLLEGQSLLDWPSMIKANVKTKA